MDNVQERNICNLSFALPQKNKEIPMKILKLKSSETENQVQLQGILGRNE
jgi:hypothetical protein